MSGPPRYPDSERDTHPRSAVPTAGGSLGAKLVIGIIVALVVVLVAMLHLTGVIGPGAH